MNTVKQFLVETNDRGDIRAFVYDSIKEAKEFKEFMQRVYSAQVQITTVVYKRKVPNGERVQ